MATWRLCALDPGDLLANEPLGDLGDGVANGTFTHPENHAPDDVIEWQVVVRVRRVQEQEQE